MVPSALLIEPCDFESYPTGGQLAFAKQLMQVFGPRLGLVGWSTKAMPVGCWTKREIAGQTYDYLCVGYRKPSAKKPLLPARLSAYLDFRRHRGNLLSLGVPYAFTQSPETLIAVSDLPWKSLCHRFPGVENPLTKPRYWWGKLLAQRFDDRLFEALKRVDVVLATADNRAIDAFVAGSRGRLRRSQVIQFLPRVDSSTFHPMDSEDVRRCLGLPLNEQILVCVGRINRVKGWSLLIEAFALLRQKRRDTLLVFVGDGEDRARLTSLAHTKGCAESVTVTGFIAPTQVAMYINAANVCVVGSTNEGCSVAMLESLACGKPLVSTDVSCARELIRQGANGFVVTDRDPQSYAEAVLATLSLPGAAGVSIEISRRFTIDSLAGDLGALWHPLAPNPTQR